MGYSLATVTATDGDYGEDGDVTYQIESERQFRNKHN